MFILNWHYPERCWNFYASSLHKYYFLLKFMHPLCQTKYPTLNEITPLEVPTLLQHRKTKILRDQGENTQIGNERTCNYFFCIMHALFIQWGAKSNQRMHIVESNQPGSFYVYFGNKCGIKALLFLQDLLLLRTHCSPVIIGNESVLKIILAM